MEDVATSRAGTLRTLYSGSTFAEVVHRLREVIDQRGLTLFAEIDHAQNARDAGLSMPPTRVLIFGSAKAGTPLMLAAPDIALELPLRVLVREEPDGRVALVYRDPTELAAAFKVEQLAQGILGLPGFVAAAAVPAP